MEQKITIPDGYELIKINDSEYKIVEKKVELPKSWEGFCEQNPIKYGECWITNNSNIETVTNSVGWARTDTWRNLLQNEEYAEALLALCQLIQLRDCYRQGWKPDYNIRSVKYTTEFYKNNLVNEVCVNTGNIFSFKTPELRDEFRDNFKDLIEKVKPLFM